MNAYEEGYNAYFQGEDVDDNPYLFETDEYEDWEEGYTDAEYNDYYEDALTDF
jgi:hypothetical protein